MSREWWFTIAAMLVMATLWRNRLRAYLEQASANVRAFDLPSAGAYDALVASVLEGFYARVTELAAASPFGEGEVKVVRWPGSVPAFVMLLLRHQPLP